MTEYRNLYDENRVLTGEDIDLNNLNLQEEEVGNIGWFSRDRIEELITNNRFLPPHTEFYSDCLEYLDKE